MTASASVRERALTQTAASRVRECLLGERPCRRVDVQGDDGGGIEERSHR